MVYHCRLCAQDLEKTKPTPEQRKAFHETDISYSYPGLYAHIEEVHGFVKNSAGKLVKL